MPQKNQCLFIFLSKYCVEKYHVWHGPTVCENVSCDLGLKGIYNVAMISSSTFFASCRSFWSYANLSLWLFDLFMNEWKKTFWERERTSVDLKFNFRQSLILRSRQFFLSKMFIYFSLFLFVCLLLFLLLFWSSCIYHVSISIPTSISLSLSVFVFASLSLFIIIYISISLFLYVSLFLGREWQMFCIDVRTCWAYL
jgi:hypothetical protein